MSAAATYTTHVCLPDGMRTGVVLGGESTVPGERDMIALEAALGINGVGALTVRLPYRSDLALIVRPDLRLEVERSIGGYTRLLGDTAWFVNGWEDDPVGNVISLFAEPAGARILADREVAAASGSAAAEKTDAADDLIKAYVRDQAISASDPLRNYASTFCIVEPDAGAGASLSWSASYRRLLQVCQEISAQSQQAGSPVFFDVVLPVIGGPLELRTYVGQRGVDRRALGTPRFGIEYGNVTGLVIRHDYRQERTAAIALGRDLGPARDTSGWRTTAEAARSPVGRREVSVSAQHAAKGATSVLVAAADATLWAARSRTQLSGDIVQTDTCRYGLDWGLGDVVPVDARGQTYSARIDTIYITVAGGAERITAPLREV